MDILRGAIRYSMEGQESDSSERTLVAPHASPWPTGTPDAMEREALQRHSSERATCQMASIPTSCQQWTRVNLHGTA